MSAAIEVRRRDPDSDSAARWERRRWAVGRPRPRVASGWASRGACPRRPRSQLADLGFRVFCMSRHSGSAFGRAAGVHDSVEGSRLAVAAQRAGELSRRSGLPVSVDSCGAAAGTLGAVRRARWSRARGSVRAVPRKGVAVARRLGPRRRVVACCERTGPAALSRRERGGAGRGLRGARKLWPIVHRWR